jgi:dUTP pyrophosphatase
MTTAESVTSPPTSPPPKRIKTDQPPLSPNVTTSIPSHTVASPATEPSKMATAVQVPRLLVKKLSDKARLPTRGSAFAAGYDVYAAKETTIPARGKALVDTDIAISVPVDTCKGTQATISPDSVVLVNCSLTTFPIRWPHCPSLRSGRQALH